MFASQVPHLYHALHELDIVRAVPARLYTYAQTTEHYFVQCILLISTHIMILKQCSFPQGSQYGEKVT